jgi:hypothetical protein
VPEPKPIWISFVGSEPPSRRTVDAAIVASFPAARRALVRFVLRLPRRSTLRQSLLRRSVLQAQGAWMRGDFELALAQYDDDVALTTSNVAALARPSGIEVEQLSAHRVELRDGLVQREQVVTARREDLEPIAGAVGIDPAELARRQVVPAD